MFAVKTSAIWKIFFKLNSLTLNSRRQVKIAISSRVLFIHCLTRGVGKIFLQTPPLNYTFFNLHSVFRTQHAPLMDFQVGFGEGGNGEKKSCILMVSLELLFICYCAVLRIRREKKGPKYHPQNIKFSRCANVYVTLKSSPFFHCDAEMKFGSG